MAQRRFGNTRQIAALALSAIGVAGAVAAWRMGLWTAGSPDAGLLPFAAAVLLTGFAAAAMAVDDEVPVPIEPAAWPRLASYGAAMLLLCVGPLAVGCLAGFAAALFVAMRCGERLTVAKALIWSVVLSVGGVLVFRIGLDVPLPDPIVDRLLGR